MSNLVTDVNQKDWEDTAFIIMWRSPYTNGTRSELRRTRRGCNRYIDTLVMLGIDRKNIHVILQPKIWKPEKRAGRKRKGVVTDSVQS